MFDFFKYITKKTLLFGVAGAMGALIASLIFEPIIHSLPKADKSLPKADVVFVLDATNSMNDVINGVKSGIISFAKGFADKNIDIKVGLVVFRDRFEDDEGLFRVKFAQGDTTDDYAEFSSKLGEVDAKGGGDGPESSLDALDLASQTSFRDGAYKIIILATDAEPKIPDYSGNDFGKINDILSGANIKQLHFVINSTDMSVYKKIHISGSIFLLNEINSGTATLEAAMPEIGKKIAESITVVQSDEEYDPASQYAVLSVFVAWTGAISLGIAIFLVIVQNRFFQKKMNVTQIIKAGLIGLFVGLIAGLIPQFLFSNFSENLALVIRLASWSLLGAIIGLAISRGVPNYPSNRALLGGLIGGLAGGFAFIVMGYIGSDSIARVVGAGIIGFFIGLMISLLEEILREAWLIVEWNAKEKTHISLGETPIVIGSSSDAHIYLSDFPSIVATIRLEKGEIKFEDKAKNKISVLKNDSKIQLGAINITVKAK